MSRWLYSCEWQGVGGGGIKVSGGMGVGLTLNMPIAAKVSAEMFKKPLWQTVLTQIRLLLGAVCSGSTLFASRLNSSVLLGNYLQQTTSADVIFRGTFFLGA